MKKNCLKTVLAIVLMASVNFPLFAQKIEGSLDVLKEVQRVGLEVDFSSAVILGMSEQEYAAYEEDWQTDKPAIVSKFSEGCNDKLDGLFYVGSYKAEVREALIRVTVLTVSQKGDMDCDVRILDSEGNATATIRGIRAKGGVFGTTLNLIGDGATHTGEALGKFLVSNFRPERKKK